jgi:iron(III) transport system ATP-binding protein
VRLSGVATHRRGTGGQIAVGLDGVSLDVHGGEILVIVGERGCGLSTLARVIAGLDAPGRGAVEIHAGSMVAATAALPAGVSVLDAVAVSPGPPGARETRVRALALLDCLGCTAVADRFPPELSAAQRLRVALARALVRGADVIVLDEPTADCDPRRRRAVRADLVAIQRRLGFTAVVTSHDQAEAMEIADRLAVMARGRIVQLGPPHDVYREPASRTAAALTGTANELPGRLAPRGGGASGVRVDTPLGELTGRSGLADPVAGEAVVALWRPEHTRLGRDEPAAANRFPVVVEASLYLGAHTQHAVLADGHRFLIWQDDVPGTTGAAWYPHDGERAWLQVDPGDVRVLPMVN